MTEVLKICIGKLSHVKLIEDSTGRVDVVVHVPLNVIVRRLRAIFVLGFALKQAKLIMIRNYCKFDHINVNFDMATELNVLIAGADLGFFVEPRGNKHFKFYLDWPVVLKADDPLYFQFMVVWQPKERRFARSHYDPELERFIWSPGTDPIHLRYADLLKKKALQKRTLLPKVLNAFRLEAHKEVMLVYKHQTYDVFFFGRLEDLKYKYQALQTSDPTSSAFKAMARSLVCEPSTPS